jgi:hypothetical protein
MVKRLAAVIPVKDPLGERVQSQVVLMLNVVDEMRRRASPGR